MRGSPHHDRPGDRTHPHAHPDSVMVTLASFSRRLHGDGRQAENIGTTDTRTIFVELKEPRPGGSWA